MKLSDLASGALVALLGVATVLHTRSFPPMPGQPIGPAMFPAIIGGGLLIAGAVLIALGRRKAGFLVAVDEWGHRPRMVVNFALVLADLLFYALALETLGFFITAFIFLAVLFFAFDVQHRWIPPLAIITTIVMHYGFYTLLRVPLPWGVLEGIAW